LGWRDNPVRSRGLNGQEFTNTIMIDDIRSCPRQTLPLSLGPPAEAWLSMLSISISRKWATHILRILSRVYHPGDWIRLANSTLIIKPKLAFGSVVKANGDSSGKAIINRFCAFCDGLREFASFSLPADSAASQGRS
jgi:hypothetical protein